MSYTKIMPRRGTAYEWSTENPVLAEGEFAIEFPDAGLGTGLCRFKIGDGFKHWNELAYGFDGASATSITGGNAYSSHLIQLRADTHKNWLEANPVLEDGEVIFVTDLRGFKVGDGASVYSLLKFVGYQDVLDFGDEDSTDGVHHIEDYSSINTAAKVNIPLADISTYSIPSSATLQDLLGIEDYGDESADEEVEPTPTPIEPEVDVEEEKSDMEAVPPVKEAEPEVVETPTVEDIEEEQEDDTTAITTVVEEAEEIPEVHTVDPVDDNKPGIEEPDIQQQEEEEVETPVDPEPEVEETEDDTTAEETPEEVEPTEDTEEVETPAIDIETEDTTEDTDVEPEEAHAVDEKVKEEETPVEESTESETVVEPKVDVADEEKVEDVEPEASVETETVDEAKAASTISFGPGINIASVNSVAKDEATEETTATSTTKSTKKKKSSKKSSTTTTES